MPASLRFLAFPAVLAAGFCAVLCGPAEAALTSRSPEVRQAVARAIQFLESVENLDGRMGAHAIRATVLLKGGKSPDHPMVKQAVQSIRGELDNLKGLGNDHAIYSASLALIFFCTLDTQEYEVEIKKLLDYLMAVQKPHGGWGYADRPTGDTSMTQHCILALWEAAESGFSVSQSSVERATLWFLKTQDPSGAFGYQGKIAEGGGLVQQSEIMHSRVAAGMASIYMGAELLGIGEKIGAKRARDDGLPPALVKQEKPSTGSVGRFNSSLDPNMFRAAMGRGNAWMMKNHTVSPAISTYYFLYSVERYWTFLELIDGQKELVDRWYDEGARWLLNDQKEDGSWHKSDGFDARAEHRTCFAALFLLRSTKSAVEKVRSFGNGTLRGGRGLPKDSDRVQIRDGRVVSATEPSEFDKLLANIGKEDPEELTKALGDVAQLPPGEAKALVSERAAKLRELAGGTSADARLAAVQALARGGSLDDVPIMIYAMSDPERDIILAARDGLRRISRRIGGFGLPDDFDEPDRQNAVKKWKEWYLAIRPDAEFEN